MSERQGIQLHRDLRCIPKDRPVVLLIRHSDRYEIPAQEVGDQIRLTPRGQQRASQMGAELRGYLVAARSSPVPRCLDTSELMIAASGAAIPIQEESLLGAPGCFIENGELAWQNFLDLKTSGVMHRQLTSSKPLLGFHATQDGVAALLRLVPEYSAEVGLNLWVSHDAIVGVFAGFYLGWQSPQGWPACLDGLWLWRSSRGIVMRVFGDEILIQPQEY